MYTFFFFFFFKQKTAYEITYGDWSSDVCSSDLVAMEVSSHALALARADGLAFDVAVFTNLTQDHLDFHGTLESYRLAKRRLFELLAESPKPTRTAVVNGDDPVGATMASGLDVA